MKITTGLLMLVIMATSGKDSEHRYSILENPGPMLVDHGPAIIQDQATVLEKPPILEESAPAHFPNTDESPIILDHHFAAPANVASVPYAPPVQACAQCRCVTCCCKPAKKIETTFCLVDPLGCEHEACVCVPACCVNEAPQITWGRRLLGRRVATLCWECCDHEVKIVITRRGKVKVRD